MAESKYRSMIGSFVSIPFKASVICSSTDCATATLPFPALALRAVDDDGEDEEAVRAANPQDWWLPPAVAGGKARERIGPTNRRGGRAVEMQTS
eukprot:CAMPEP_0117582888 /NCGR_PEP_ID=MMETSP0784-20121206/66687_1 /TAXON_ID=39447 /ORGANISM="" /LENGTH=93 /DNA_ID=CAMNT_0005383469 /DNA_START=154 /DNA_END=432 /DNA_ORIENTATION=+